MAKIKSIDELKDHLLNVIEKLENDTISMQDAQVTGKLCESVLHTIKLQMEYARMKGAEESFSLPFMKGNSSENLIEHEEVSESRNVFKKLT